MATESMRDALRQIRLAVGAREDAATDGQLLERFVQGHDESAFATLLSRHGHMVWDVCRRLLARAEDVEDAFQATFLVLVRKGRSVTPREQVASWLHGVARHTALKARALALRRGFRERQVQQMPEPEIPRRDGWEDLRPVFDEELSRLPARYRSVLVLCDLEGKTRTEAARQLGVPEGTVAGQLARARGMLAKRLARRGVGLSGGALAAMLAQNLASANVPTSVVSATIKAACGYSIGTATGAISPTVAAITEGVLMTMVLSKLKIATVVLLTVLACVGSGTVALLPVAVGRPATEPEKQEEKVQTAKKAEDAFPGEWELVKGQKGGLGRITIAQTKEGWTIQAWGTVSGGEKDQGKTTLTLLRDYEEKGDTDAEKTMNKYGFAVWDHKFAKSHMTLRVENDRLLVETYRVFTDKSDRPNFRSAFEFKKKN